MTTAPKPGDRIRYYAAAKKRARVGTVENIIQTLDGQDAATITKLRRAAPVSLADIIEIYDPTKTKKRKGAVGVDGGGDQAERAGAIIARESAKAHAAGQERAEFAEAMAEAVPPGLALQIHEAIQAHPTHEQRSEGPQLGLQPGSEILDSREDVRVRGPRGRNGEPDLFGNSASGGTVPPQKGTIGTAPVGPKVLDAGVRDVASLDSRSSEPGAGARLAHKSAPKGLTVEQVREIRRRFKPRHKTDGGAAMGREFGVGQPMISMIAHRVKRKGVK